MAPIVNTGLGFPARMMVLSSFRRALFLCVSTLCLGALANSVLAAVSADSKIQYNRDIRPILSENCFACHGADSASRKAGLRLDHFEQATAADKDGKHAIVPGNPKESLLVQKITATDPDDIMPPPRTLKTLSPAQKDTLQKWIADGAKYQPHWSFIAPVKPELPKVKNKRWVRNPIDAFVLANMEKAGLKPSPEADRRTLCRRVTLDLTGLPPEPADVEAFVADKSPNAYEKLVDRLLASPQYGEHRARYWLDCARYGDTHGIHIDNYREMWSYRDWVINALNQNLHFDEFTIEQLAGDLLPNRTLDQQIASGFNRCNITTSEGGAIDEEYLVLYARDRTETTSRVWLGLTAGCAVCHDHKFDPLPQKEFYSLSAFFNNTTQKGMDGNIKDTPPAIPVPLAADRAEWDAIAPRLKAGEKKMDSRRKAAQHDFDNWMTNADPDTFSEKMPQDTPLFSALLDDDKPKNTNDAQTITYHFKGQEKELTLASNANWQFGIVADKAFSARADTSVALPEVGDFETTNAFSYGAWVYLNRARDGALISRMDDTNNFRGWDLWFEGTKPGTHIINKWPDDALKVVANKEIPFKQWTHVFITYDGSAKASGVKIYVNGEEQAATPQADKLTNSIHTTVPFRIGQRNTTSPLDNAGVQDLRLYQRVLKPEEVKSLAKDSRMAYLLDKPVKKRNKREKEELYDAWLTTIDKPYLAAAAAVAKEEKESEAIRARGTEALVMQESTNTPTAYVLYRGEYDKRRDKVGADTPAALPPMPTDLPHDRLGFAKWLLLPENPLTARVTVNRFWEEIFGIGIVKSTGDFGTTGELPSNQALLDWLAVDFRESDWDMKRFFKQVVMSATYRQSAVITPEKLAKDPDNILLSRGPRFRMDAEMVRDYALAASGLLVKKIGGPSVKPYQPDGVWEAVAMDVSNTRFYKRDSGDNLYRRSMYTFWKRAAPPASMEIFNAPSRETCTVRRERTDTPLQALVTMDDPQFIEAARHLAQLALENGGAKEQARIDFMAERLLARPLRPQERKITQGVLKDLLAHYQADSKEAEELLKVGESKVDAKLDKPTLAAYTMLANELMNMDEVLNK